MQHSSIDVGFSSGLVRIQSSQLMLDALVSHQPFSSPAFIINLNRVVHSEFFTHVRI